MTVFQLKITKNVSLIVQDQNLVGHVLVQLVHSQFVILFVEIQKLFRLKSSVMTETQMDLQNANQIAQAMYLAGTVQEEVRLLLQLAKLVVMMDW